MKKRMMAAPVLLLGALLMGPGTGSAQMSTTSQSQIAGAVGTATDRTGSFHIDRFEKRGRKIYAVGWFSGGDTLTSYYLRDTPVWIFGAPTTSSSSSIGGTTAMSGATMSGSMDGNSAWSSSADGSSTLGSSESLSGTYDESAPTSSSLAGTLSPNTMDYGLMYGPAVPDYGYFWTNQAMSADTLALGYGVIPDTTTADSYDTATDFAAATGSVNGSLGVSSSLGGSSYGYHSYGSVGGSFGGGSFGSRSNLSGYSSYDNSGSDNTGVSPGFSSGGSSSTNMSNTSSGATAYDSLGADFVATPGSLDADVSTGADLTNGSVDASMSASSSSIPSTSWNDDWANWNGDTSVTITSYLGDDHSTVPTMTWSSSPNADEVGIVTWNSSSPTPSMSASWNGVDVSRIQDQSGMVALPVVFAGASCDAVHLTLGPVDARNNILKVGNPTTVHANSVGPFDVELSSATLGSLGNGDQSICAISKLINGDGARTAIVDKLNQLIGAPTVGPVRDGTMK